MQNLLAIWANLNLRRRAVVVGATLAVFVAVLALSQFAATPGMSLLYAGLDGRAAGEVIAALDQKGATYEVRGDSIYVEDGQRDPLRMTLAAEGLPRNAGTGYELLDGLSGFGTTSQMFDAAYWRAKEGELARTVLALPQIRAARVHIAQAPSQMFQRDAKASASVTVTTAAGGLAPAQAAALRHLVASAVPGMQAADVSVIDSVGGLIAEVGDALTPAAAGDARASEIKRNVERLLEARVGAGKAVVEVAVEVVTEREAITERKLDPQGRVAISSATEIKSGSATDPGGAVTVASNLPTGQAASGAAGKNESSENRETVNYEVSETSREVLREPGAVKRISVAVLVDGQSATGADGLITVTPRPEEELAVLRELVSSAVGLDPARGDVLTLKSLTFQPDPAAGELVTAGLLPPIGPIDAMSVIQIAVLSLVALILGLFVIRPVLVQAARRPLGLPLQGPALALPGGGDAARVLTGEIDDGPGSDQMSLIVEAEEVGTPQDPVARLRRLIELRQTESVEILRGWMEHEEERG